MEGVDNLMKILYTLQEDTNVFVISHKGELEDASFQERLNSSKRKTLVKLNRSI